MAYVHALDTHDGKFCDDPACPFREHSYAMIGAEMLKVGRALIVVVA